jgi:anti-anti-sigma factor
MMQPGKILFAEHEGAFIIKLVGDVRLTLCTSFDEFLERMFSHPKFLSVVVDLNDADGIDSTTLGLLAKLAIQSQKRFKFRPILFCAKEDILRIICSMGFDEVFEVQQGASQIPNPISELPMQHEAEDVVRQRIICAHKVLMDLRAENRLRFQELIKALEASSR